MRESGWKILMSETGEEYKSGLKVPAMRATGKITEHLGEAVWFILMATYTKVSGKTIRPMDLESISMLMVQAMKAIGKMINNTAMEKK
jgi:hypothetical protein